MGNFCLFLLSNLLLIHFSIQATNDGNPIELTILDLDVEVDEEQARRVQLGTGSVLQCADPTDGDPTRVYISNVSPNSPCGATCFELEPCGVFSGDANATTEWCLYYLASQGSFVYSSAPIYTMTVVCTDDIEAPDTAIMSITVRPNTPPVFVPSAPLSVLRTINGLATPQGTTIYDVVTDDVDGDAVYYTMTTSPTTDILDIVYTGGSIKATNDFRFFCENKITASVEAQDNYNPEIGPLTVEITVDPYNAPPVVTNLDTTVIIDENVGVGFAVIDLATVDTTIYTEIYINLRAEESEGMEMYAMEGTQLKTKLDPDYERADTRVLRLYFDLDDGYCRATSTYTLTVSINDLPEDPVFSEDNAFIEVYEGNINAVYGQYVIDEDENEVFTYELSRANSFFGVDSGTGSIYSLTEIDIDSNVMYEDFDVYILAKDTANLETQELHVTVRVYDYNDNPPYFNSPPYVVAATDCTDPGTVIGTVEGTDDDSSYNQNDYIYFGGSGEKFTVMATGEIVLTETCADGEGFTGTATITDMGIVPGPLSGTEATVTMTCGPCQTVTVTPAPATTTGASTSTASTVTANTVTTTTTTTTTAAPVADDQDISDILGWVVPAVIGAIIWLVLTAYFCNRFCRCPKAFERRPRRVKVQPPQRKPPPQPQPPPPKPMTPPPPPPPPEPEPDPYLFGFWKETYTNQDHTQEPERNAQPKPIEKMPLGEGNAEPPENLKLGGPGDNTVMPRFLPGKPETPPERVPSPATPPPKCKWFCRP